MLKKRVYNDGSVKYFDAHTNREVKLLRVGAEKLGRLPNYVFRYLSPGVTARGPQQEGIPNVTLGTNPNAGRGSNFTAPRKRSRQKH